MKSVISFGQALIDFVPLTKGVPLCQVEQYHRAPGGACANRAAAVAKLGGKARFIGMVGADEFGECLEQALREVGVDTSSMLRTTATRTGLAFVALREDGERDFIFYPKPSADQLIRPEHVDRAWFEEEGIFSFGALSLIHPDAAAATKTALRHAARSSQMIVCDPNYRADFWSGPDAFRSAIIPLLGDCDIVKFSDEDAFVLSGVSDKLTPELENASTDHPLWQSCMEWVERQAASIKIITRGARGVVVFVGENCFALPSPVVDSIDATGAGDAFIGAILYSLAERSFTKTELRGWSIHEPALHEIITFAMQCGAIACTRKGAIPALPTRLEVMALLSNRNKSNQTHADHIAIRVAAATIESRNSNWERDDEGTVIPIAAP